MKEEKKHCKGGGNEVHCVEMGKEFSRFLPFHFILLILSLKLEKRKCTSERETEEREEGEERRIIFF